MFLLVSQMAFGVVGLLFLPHRPEDFQPAVTQPAQGGGVCIAFSAVGLIIRLGPGAASKSQGHRLARAPPPGATKEAIKPCKHPWCSGRPGSRYGACRHAYRGATRSIPS